MLVVRLKILLQLMNRLINSTTTTEIPLLFDYKISKLVYSDVDRAKLLNNYFCSLDDWNDENIKPPFNTLRVIIFYRDIPRGDFTYFIDFETR